MSDGFLRECTVLLERGPNTAREGGVAQRALLLKGLVARAISVCKGGRRQSLADAPTPAPTAPNGPYPHGRPYCVGVGLGLWREGRRGSGPGLHYNAPPGPWGNPLRRCPPTPPPQLHPRRRAPPPPAGVSRPWAQTPECVPVVTGGVPWGTTALKGLTSDGAGHCNGTAQGPPHTPSHPHTAQRTAPADSPRTYRT